VSRLSAAVDVQAAANVEQRERNRQLVAEVNDLKGGLTALEERARSELGMVGSSETFYQVVTAATPPPAAPATGVTARAQ
jgi:cell division protein FtsB